LQSFEINKNQRMKVFKFGGASVKDAAAIRNAGAIVKAHAGTPLLVVVSAMGKTTNALERVVSLGCNKKNFLEELKTIRDYHCRVSEELSLPIQPIESVFEQIHSDVLAGGDFDEVYDRVVSQGEILSSLILNQYLYANGSSSCWIDARKIIITDTNWREGNVDWDETRMHVKALEQVLAEQLIVTQGFIGSSYDGRPTTLGREGSDYSAAIFAACLSAASVTIWKDVPGVMSADPKRIPSAVVFDELPYQEAAEMTYYGASVIHPKTIKPLANAKIPLLVKNFHDPSLAGTIIHDCRVDKLPPLIVFKDNQCLISCKVTDYTFVNEEQIGFIFHSLTQHRVSFNVMQNSAITFSFCVDFRDQKTMALIKELGTRFEVYYNTGLTLITIKNYDSALFNEYRNRSDVLLEQSSRSTLQVLVKNESRAL
jgi:aspartate kinase